jgi:hypothetical protein
MVLNNIEENIFVKIIKYLIIKVIFYPILMFIDFDNQQILLAKNMFLERKLI